MKQLNALLVPLVLDELLSILLMSPQLIPLLLGKLLTLILSEEPQITVLAHQLLLSQPILRLLSTLRNPVLIALRLELILVFLSLALSIFFFHIDSYEIVMTILASLCTEARIVSGPDHCALRASAL